MKSWINLFLQETLDKNRIDILKYFKEIKKMWFYLAWWTALALQFWHRQSVDFDFFVNWDFKENELFEKMLEVFKWEKIKKTFSEKNTLYIEVNWIKISFFWYKYDLIDDLIETEFFNLASYKDIWAMKIWALQKRATKKDYVDIYYLLQKMNVFELIDCFYEKFWNVVTNQIILKSLVYFEDVVDEGIIFNDKNLDFEDIKKFLIEVVRKSENL